MAKRAPRTTTRRTAASVNNDSVPAMAAIDLRTEQLSEEDVRVRAYHRYLERGGTDGNDLSDWVEAEKELKVAPQS